jgi:hypothetical protein
LMLSGGGAAGRDEVTGRLVINILPKGLRWHYPGGKSQRAPSEVSRFA